MSTIQYTPPPTIKSFITYYLPHELFYAYVVGPVGSGKTTGLFFKLIYMASLQEPSADGVRRTRAVIVRNTAPQLKDTTLVSWSYWFKDGEAGKWFATDRNFLLRFNDVECMVMFRPLDTEDDIARVLSLEINFAIVDEFTQIPRKIIDALSARLGRFRLPDGTKPTNWGLWGSSNPDTEDNWYFDYLHRTSEDPSTDLPENGHYFHQPGGFEENAENLDNLPGGRDYYTNQAKGKSEAWVNQYLNARWGYSVSGQPVVPTFKTHHVSKSPLKYNPALPLVIGLDPGLIGSALVFGQEDLHSRLLVLGELVQNGYGAERLITERLKPYLRRRFPDAEPIIAPDPASLNRAQTDERAVVDAFKRHYTVKAESNNRLAIRLEAIESFTTRLTDLGPALLVDKEQCPTLTRALSGGWRYVIDAKRDMARSATPEKNQYSHPGDSFGYLCRYFHRQTEREKRYAPAERLIRQNMIRAKSYERTYHVR